jgi:DNA-directed RNA polymerase specialized sigma24 family protein
MSVMTLPYEDRLMAEDSVTRWLDQLKQGDREAVQRLWERYFVRLARLTRHWLRHAPRQAADEEDIALAAFASFCRCAEEGRFPRLADRDDLWQLLVLIAFRKSCNQVRDEGRQPHVVHASQLQADDAEPRPLFADLIGREPEPGQAFQAIDKLRGLLDMLGDPTLQKIAVWKMEGYSNEEIAAVIGRSLPTVERKLRRIRQTWAKEVPHE